MSIDFTILGITDDWEHISMGFGASPSPQTFIHHFHIPPRVLAIQATRTDNSGSADTAMISGSLGGLEFVPLSAITLSSSMVAYTTIIDKPVRNVKAIVRSTSIGGMTLQILGMK